MWKTISISFLSTIRTLKVSLYELHISATDLVFVHQKTAHMKPGLILLSALLSFSGALPTPASAQVPGGMAVLMQDLGSVEKFRS